MKDAYPRLKAIIEELRAKALDRLETGRAEVEELAAEHPAVKVLFDACIREIESVVVAEGRLVTKAAARFDAKRTKEARDTAAAATQAVIDKAKRAQSLFLAFDREHARATGTVSGAELAAAQAAAAALPPRKKSVGKAGARKKSAKKNPTRKR
jgi:hypothetical protein